MAHNPLSVMHMVADEGKAGSDRLALDVAKGLRRRGHRVIWGSPSFCCLNEEAASANLEIYDLYPKGILDISCLGGFVRFCETENIQIVNGHHSHNRHFLLRAGLKGLRSKVVFTRHCLLKTLPYLGAFPHNFLVDMNIAVSEAVRVSLLQSGILPGRAVTIYGGVETEKFLAIPAEKIRDVRKRVGRPGAVTIGMIARLQHAKNFSPEKPTLKGHEVLFRALAGFKRDVNLLLLGPWLEYDKEKLRRIAEHCGLETAKITFCGFQEDMAPFYGIMDINVLPSPREGFPLALLEPMAAGVPCIGADGGGIREIITNGVDGFLFTPGNSGELAEKIRVLCEDRALRELFVSNAREKVCRRFHIERHIDGTEEVYYRLFDQ